MASLLQSTTIGGHSAIHAGNIGSQSVNYANSAGSTAWTNVSGRPTALSQFTNDLGNYGGWITSAALANYLTTSQVTSSMISGLNNMLGVTSLPYSVDITVGGDPDKFYAVQFWGGDQDVWRRIIIKRGYSEPAPWDPIGTGVHHGGLLLDWEGNFGGWGGAEYADRLRVFNESYTNVCADMFIYSHSMGYVFMLRGGGALYHLHSDQAINGYYQAGSPDILYSTSTLSYDDNWSGTNVYDVYAPAPLSLGQVNSTRIDGLRTKKQSLLDGRYLRQGIDISGIGNITSTNSYATNFFASNAFYLNGASYFLNSTNGGIYTNARFESATLLVAPGGNSSQWNTAYGWGNHASAGYATQAYVNTAVSNLVDSAPGTLDTLNELAAALGDDPNFATTVTSNIATKLPLAGGTMSGRLTLKSISGVAQTVPNDFGAYLHLGDWGVGRTDPGAVLVNTAYRADYATDLFDMNISRFTNNSGYLTSLPSHNHDDRYYTEGESDGRYVPYGSLSGSFGLNDNKLYLRTNNDNNHYIWNAADDWEEIVAYSGTGLRIASSTGVTLATFTTSGNLMNTALTVSGPVYQGASNQGIISLLSDVVVSETNNYFRLYLPQGYYDNRNGGTATIKVVWGMLHAGITYSQEYKLTFGTNHGAGGNHLIVSDVTRTYTDQNPDSYGGYLMDQTPAVDFYQDRSGGYINFNVKGVHSYNTHRLVAVDIVGGGVGTPVLSYYGTTSPGGNALTVKDIPYATLAGSASIAGQVTVNYDNNSNSTYQLLWGSGNSVYGTTHVYVNPSTDVIYAKGGYASPGNPWNTADSAFFPNGITTAGNDNWIYGHTYIAQAPGNGSGHEYWSDGSEFHKTTVGTASHGQSGKWLTLQSAIGNFIPYSFESNRGDHSWGIVARYRINTADSDRPSIQFSYGGNDTRWNVGYCSNDDNFRVTQNMGYRNDNSTSDGWGTERFKIDTSGNTYAAIGGTLYANGNAVITSANIGSQSVTYATNSTRLYASDGTYVYGGANPYYLYMNYDGGSYWELKVSPATPGTVRVAYSNVSGSANAVAWTNVSGRPTALSQFTNDITISYTETDTLQSVTSRGASTSTSITAVDFYTAGWFRNSSALNGLYNSAYDTHFYASGTGQWNFATSNGSWIQIALRPAGHESTVRGYLYADTSNNVGLLTYDGNWGFRVNASKNAFVYGTDLTVGNSTSSNIYMTDTDETTRRIHCNSGRIGFLNSANAWGAWNDNTGNWSTDFNMYASSGYFYGSGSIRLGDMWGGAGLYRPSGSMVFGIEDSDWIFSKGAITQAYFAGGDGNLWMRWAGDWLSNLLGAKQNASTAINTSNIGSQSVSYATNSGNSNTTSQIVFSDLKINFPSGAGGGHNFGSNHYSMGLDSGNGGWDHPHYRDLIIGYHTGIRIGANYSGVRFYSDSPTTDTNNDGNGDGTERLLMTIGGYVGTANHTDVVVNNNLIANVSMRAPIFYDSNDTSYYLDPNGTSNLQTWTADTAARLGRSRYWTNRWAIYGSANDYMTGTNGWGTDEGTWANAWKGGFSGWDIWGTGTDHPQGSGYVHAQGIISGQHAASADGSSAYGWMMVGAHNATENRYWLRGKWSTSISGWVEMITTGNIGSQSVNYAATAGSATTATNFNNGSAYSSGGVVYVDTLESISGADWLELVYYGGAGVRIGTGVNGSKALYAGSLYDAGNRVYSAGNPQVNITGNAATATSATYLNSSNYIAQRGSNGSWNADFQATPAATMSYGGDLGANGTNGPGGSWWIQQNFRHTNSSNYWGTQVAWGWEDNANRLATRNVTGGNYGAWVYYLNSSNFTSYIDAPNKAGTSYYQVNTWLQFNGTHGLYWPSYYGGHFSANDLSTYTQFAFRGEKNGYGGFYDFHSRVNGAMYDSGGNGGVYREANGLWYWYYHVGNNSMGIGSSANSSSYVVYASGSIYATGDIVAYSDRRKKTDIVTIDSALDKVMAMRGVFYTKIDESEKGRQVGVIAQEVNEILPEAVTYAADVDEYGVKYGNIVGVLIEAIKEQQKEIDELKAKLN